MTSHASTPVRIFPTAEALGDGLARHVLAGIDRAATAGRPYLLGCPGGRSLMSTYAALARLARDHDLSGLVIVMMDDYLGPDPTRPGSFRRVDPDAHFSCERFGRTEIAAPLGLAADRIWLPEPDDPTAYDRRLEAAGGVDCFLAASGATDGHVAFNPPGSDLEGSSRIVELAEATRRDNLGTFPGFGSLDAVPTHGVSVGLGTIARLSREIRLVLVGEGKREAAARLLSTTDVDRAWPASFVRGCPQAEIWLDEAAAGPEAAARPAPGG